MTGLRLLAAVLLAIAVLLVVRGIAPGLGETPSFAGEAPVEPDFSSPRYFQGHPGEPLPLIRPEEALVQIKRVAASRGIVADSVRQAVNAQAPNGGKIDIRALNQALDSLSPQK